MIMATKKPSPNLRTTGSMPPAKPKPKPGQPFQLTSKTKVDQKKFGSSDVFTNVPGDSSNRDLSVRNARYAAQVAGRNKTARQNSKTKPR